MTAQHNGSDAGSGRKAPELVAPVNRINVALPFSHLHTEERSHELGELARIVEELVGEVAQLAPGPRVQELHRRAKALATETAER